MAGAVNVPSKQQAPAPLGSAASCCPVSVAQLFTIPLGNPVGRYCKSSNREQGNNSELRLWVPGTILFLKRLYFMTYVGSLSLQVHPCMTFLPRGISHPKTLTNRQPNCYIGGLEPHGIKTTLKSPTVDRFPIPTERPLSFSGTGTFTYFDDITYEDDVLKLSLIVSWLTWAPRPLVHVQAHCHGRTLLWLYLRPISNLQPRPVLKGVAEWDV